MLCPLEHIRCELHGFEPGKYIEVKKLIQDLFSLYLLDFKMYYLDPMSFMLPMA
jgi:hypothetical protein